MICIFCEQKAPNNTVAHIIPESLGGKNSPVGMPGVTCDACNQYFGQKVESKALASFPFIAHRIFSGIPSKKNLMPSMKATIGEIRATGMLGTIEVEPRSECVDALVEAGDVTQFRILAEVTEPLAVCRMLLKIGLEQLGKHFYEVAAAPRVKAAREFSRRPRRGQAWWFILRCDPHQYVKDLRENTESSIEIVESEGVLFSVMNTSGASTMIPLEESAQPPSGSELPEPEFRIIHAVC
jgi:hypothetical protein